jgi:prepilin-type N-terminal cleavage/methylation domain-containing protein
MSRRRHVCSARQLRDQRGFTIVETMVAIGIMAFAFLGMATVHAVSAKAQSLGQNQGLARFVADQKLENARRLAVTSMDGTWATASCSGDSVVQGVKFSSVCTVSNVPMGKRLSVTTSWTDRFGSRTLTLTTIVSQVTNPS